MFHSAGMKYETGRVIFPLLDIDINIYVNQSFLDMDSV